jgi:hypothetical protein
LICTTSDTGVARSSGGCFNPRSDGLEGRRAWCPSADAFQGYWLGKQLNKKNAGERLRPGNYLVKGLPVKAVGRWAALCRPRPGSTLCRHRPWRQAVARSAGGRPSADRGRVAPCVGIDLQDSPRPIKANYHSGSHVASSLLYTLRQAYREAHRGLWRLS